MGLQRVDFVALVVILGALVLIGLGKSTDVMINVLMVVVGYYFGYKGSKVVEQALGRRS